MTKLRNLLIVDVETTGLDFEENAPIEFGAILFDVEHRAITHQFSALLPSVVTNGAEDLNKIPGSLLGKPPVTGLVWESVPYLDRLFDFADAIVAHNAGFDRQWLLPILSSHLNGEKVKGTDNRLQVPWLCTLRDFRWKLPGLRSAPSVVDLALAHGVPVWQTHRALTDCGYLAQVLASRQDLPELLLDAQTPQILYEAVVIYEQREMVKAAGFRWQEHKERTWTSYLREDEAQALPFRVVAVASEPQGDIAHL